MSTTVFDNIRATTINVAGDVDAAHVTQRQWGPWTTPTLLNSWVAVNATPQFRREGNILRLRGQCVTGANNTVIFNVGARNAPPQALEIPASARNGAVALSGLVLIGVNGNVTALYETGLTNFGLDSIAWVLT